jgi:hypothetical protein
LLSRLKRSRELMLNEPGKLQRVPR